MNKYFPEYSVFLIMKYIVKQTHALLININNKPIGFSETPNSLKPCENGINAFANTNRTTYKNVAESIFNIVFTINFFCLFLPL